MPRLEFTHRHRYASQTEGIALPVILKSGAEAVDVLASVDTGASNCLFEREHGDMLDIGVETGEPKTFWTANGRVEAFGHVVEIEFAGLSVESMVYFFADLGVSEPRAVCGNLFVSVTTQACLPAMHRFPAAIQQPFRSELRTATL
jgi:hypothetical protein